MRVSIFGSGYVGLVTGVCFAERGHRVLCGDCDVAKTRLLSAGQSPIYEHGLSSMLARNLHNGRLSFTTDLDAAARASQVCIIAVGTPSRLDGSVESQYLDEVGRTLAANMVDYTLVVVKSTVPVGTARKLRDRITTHHQKTNMKVAFDVVSNPEFLKEGVAIADCLHPDRIIVGCDASATDAQARALLEELYAPFIADKVPFLWMDTVSSELTKYAANAMLATKISFINEMAALCDAVGADIRHIRHGIATDPRIGPHFIQAGLGYGGSCLSKDIQALIFGAGERGVKLPMLRAVQDANLEQRDQFFSWIQEYFKHELKNKKVAVWGIAFKPNTDDIRDAPALCIIRKLLRAGAWVQAYDPAAMGQARQSLIGLANLSFADNAYAAVQGADALCIITEWEEFTRIDLEHVLATMRGRVIFDGRGVLPTESIQALGDVKYVAFGRPTIHGQSHEAKGNTSHLTSLPQISPAIEESVNGV